jgi:hypothetical protein
LTLIFISLKNVGSNFLRYGNAWGFVHRFKFLSESGYPGFEDVQDVVWCLYFGISRFDIFKIKFLSFTIFANHTNKYIINYQS